MPQPPAPDELCTGDLVAGRYRLGRLLGSGGMAHVWEATDERLHRDVAVKVLRDAAGSGELAATARHRFREEGRLAARQPHPGLVAVFDAGEADGRAYLVMERLSGETLGDRLAGGPLASDEVRSMMSEVLAALEAAHQAGIVHRDVKPGNVLRGADGGWKVADFGIAKSVEQALASDLTLTGQVIGTPRYMAPERLAGQPATVAGDIYSAGVLLQDALAGCPDPDPDLEAVADRATALDPRDRFPSARSMAAALASSSEPQPDVTLVDAIAAGPAVASAPTIVTAGPPTQVLPTPAPARGRGRAAPPRRGRCAPGGRCARRGGDDRWRRARSSVARDRRLLDHCPGRARGGCTGHHDRCTRHDGSHDDAVNHLDHGCACPRRQAREGRGQGQGVQAEGLTDVRSADDGGDPAARPPRDERAHEGDGSGDDEQPS
ncbi:serine/threonine-protein kinase [Aquihabitans daechungensis]|uniref:serine/threonine-protein kinase n=1 Tax=Aquihabitans daechungensis TaxID=1052257 RepID=UPI003B9EE512